jgi:transcriptional regulator with PAS, ATPase and Fis domain
LGVDPQLIADVMLFNIEIAQTLSAEREIKQEAFYKSMLKSFEDAIHFIKENGIYSSFSKRLMRIVDNTDEQNWFNKGLFENLIQKMTKSF